MTTPTNDPRENEPTLPPLTVEAMRRLCQELMKDNKGDYILMNYLGGPDAKEYVIRNAQRNDTNKTVELS